MTDTIEYRGRTLTITRGPAKDQYGRRLPTWFGRYDGDTSDHCAETRKELIARFQHHVDCTLIVVPEIDALLARWASSIKDISPRFGLAAATEIMMAQMQMKMAQTMMRTYALQVEQQIAELRAKCADTAEPLQVR